MAQPKPTLVNRWISPKGFEVDLTREQEQRFRTEGFWPVDPHGQEFSRFSQGPHVDTPTFSDEEIESFVHTKRNGL